MEMGPISLRTDRVGGVGFDRFLHIGEMVKVQNRVLVVGNHLQVMLDPADVWEPRRQDELPEVAIVLRNMVELHRIAPLLVPADGLARLIWQDPVFGHPGEVLKLAQSPFRSLFKWLRGALCGQPPDNTAVPKDATRLLGHGPGLTPSGDDLICGVLIALRILEFSPIAERLYNAVRQEAKRRTSRLSAAHIAVAADGWGAEVLHDAANSLLMDESASLLPRLRDLERIGHTSGWDALAGVTLTVGSWLQATTGRKLLPQCTHLDEAQLAANNPLISGNSDSATSFGDRSRIKGPARRGKCNRSGDSRG